MLNKHINNATTSEGTLLLAQPVASCAARTSRRRAGSKISRKSRKNLFV